MLLRNISVFSFILLLFACKSLPDKKMQAGYIAQIYKDVELLSHDDMQGRETGKPGEKKAAKYIAQRFMDLGLEPKGEITKGKSQLQSYYQDFISYESSNPHGHGDMPGEKTPVPTRNVAAMIDNQAELTIVIGGHYDHLGYGSFGSLYTGPAEIHNGADDNASGIAGLLFLAQKLKDKKYAKANYLFLAFSGEEKGLWGSNYWVKHPTVPLEQLNFMINFDMIGRLNENKLAINGVGTSPSWDELESIGKDFELTLGESGIGPSDHSSFYLEGIPSLHFFTGQHEDYHKPSDDVELVNMNGIYKVCMLVEEIVREFAYEKIEYTKTKDEQKVQSAFKVTLGVVPDYLFNEKGMRIDGVREGRTASVAGLKKGDVVVRMGDIDIVDMQSYMKALGEFEPGQTTMVVVKRDGKMLEKEIVFQ